MGYEFLTTCAKCGIEFMVFWVMDPIRVGPQSVAKMICPACGKTFCQTAADLIPFKDRGEHFLTGHPVRSVEVGYDCPYCGYPEIIVSHLHSNLSRKELLEETAREACCHNPICPERGLRQMLKPTRVQVETLSPS